MLLSGCAARAMARDGGIMASESFSMKAAAPQPDRMIIKRGGLTIAVDDTKKAAEAAAVIVKNFNGIVQSENQYEETYYMYLKVPAEKLETAVDMLSKLGDVKNSNMSKDDVTMQVTDSEAVLKNKRALRDRLRQILNQAKDVKDIIAVEAELSRVQSEIDSMEAMLKNLKGQVAMSDINLTLEKKRMPGPLGWVFMGLWWVVEKLFIW